MYENQKKNARIWLDFSFLKSLSSS